MKTGRAQQQLMAEQVSLLDRAITRVEDEIAYIKAASSLDITCQRLALYDVLDNYSYVARRCNFPSLPTLKNTSKAVQRERGVSSGEGPLLSFSEEDKTLENSRGKRKCQELEPEPAPKRNRNAKEKHEPPKEEQGSIIRNERISRKGTATQSKKSTKVVSATRRSSRL